MKCLRFGILFLCLVIFSFFQTCSGRDFSILEMEDYEISETALYYFDSNCSLDIRDVSLAKFQGKLSLSHIIKNAINKEECYWIALTIKNECRNQNLSWYLGLWSNGIDSLVFYSFDKQGAVFKKNGGLLQPFSKRKIFNTDLVFFLNIQPGETGIYYLKIHTKFYKPLLFHVFSNEKLIENTVIDYWFLGVFYSVLFFILFMNIYLFISERKKIYLYYLFCITSGIWYCLCRDGLGFQFLWPENPEINRYTNNSIGQFLVIFFVLVYCNSFLNLRKKQANFFKLSLFAILFKTMILIFDLYNRPVTPIIMLIVDGLTLGIPLLAGIKAFNRGEQYSRYYIIAFFSLFTGFLLKMINECGWLPYSKFNFYFIHVGLFLEVVFMGLALIDQIKILKDENSSIQQNALSQLQENGKLKANIFQKLEAKVEERTERLNSTILELELKSLELLAINERYSEMNALFNNQNSKLKTEFNQAIKSRILFKEVGMEDFQQIFPDENACYKYLSELKWQFGYKCKKCGFPNFSSGKIPFGRRCKSCNYDESPTADTLFHKLKFPIHKAFYLLYLVNQDGKELTMDELSEILNLRRETCWLFKQKILLAKTRNTKKSEMSGHMDGWETFALISFNN
jgi:hypothetical protein